MAIDTTLKQRPPYQFGSLRIADYSDNAPYVSFVNEGGSDDILMPIPQNITSNVGIQWEQVDMGMLGQMEQLTGTALKNAGNLANMEIIDAATSIGKGLTTLLKESITAAALSNANPLSDFTRNKIGKILHPMSEMTFRGVGFRQFNFNFDLIPKSKEKQNQIKDAVAEFQKYSLPKVDGVLLKYFTYPNTWKIKFRPNDNYLPKILPAYCTNVQVDYAGGGKMSWHRDTAPGHIILSLAFTEAEMYTADHITRGMDG